MQLREKIKEGHQLGEPYGEVPVEILRGLREPPIKLQAQISFQPEQPNKGQLTFAQEVKSGQWVRNNPKEQARFLSIVYQETFTILVHPHPELKAGLARVGWLTSAYLLAFYAFGYRYILH